MPNPAWAALAALAGLLIVGPHAPYCVCIAGVWGPFRVRLQPCVRCRDGSSGLSSRIRSGGARDAGGTSGRTGAGRFYSTPERPTYDQFHTISVRISWTG